MNTEQTRGRSRGPRKGGSSTLLCDRPLAGLAILVRGSSRRITTMTAGLRARSANIRVSTVDTAASTVAWPAPATEEHRRDLTLVAELTGRSISGACPGMGTGRVPDIVEQAPCASACWRHRLERRQTPDKNISDRRGPEPESIRKMRLASLTLDLRNLY